MQIKKKIQWMVTVWACLVFMTPNTLLPDEGKVYLVLGSDTAIWHGMNVKEFHCNYDLSLYTDPMDNAYGVMDPAFRSQFRDSRGTPLKMTWWMMAGNIFRYAENTNVPIPNIMTMYLMKKYHGNEVLINGDELSLHYHTFAWTDYDNDGIYYWNQAKTFLECKDDFDYTLCQFLLEEEVFPVSFRSGWHYMDNDWQHYLNELLPYSMHNAYPNVRTNDTEPIDNIYDWSQAPSEFVPYHPSLENYQVPGDGPGWNVRSIHFRGCLWSDIMNDIFYKADRGIDQVACIWGHLPESDFLTNIAAIDSLVQATANQYPDVEFHYSTAIEAMQLWQNTADTVSPQLHIQAVPSGENVTVHIQTDEPIFQTYPFVAVKNIYEEYFKVPCMNTGENEWETTQPINEEQLAKIGVAVCDTVGNQSLEFIRYRPDDMFVDNPDAGYMEINGSWSGESSSSWGTDSRRAAVGYKDSVKVRWTPEIKQTGYYNVFVQVPAVNNPPEQIQFRLFENAQVTDTTSFSQPLPATEWVYVGTSQFTENGENYLEMTAYNHERTTKTMAADVAKFSALVRERDLQVTPQFLNFGEVSQNDTISYSIELTNRGISDLTVSDVASAKNTFSADVELPFTIPAMESVKLPILFTPLEKGVFADSILISSNDPVKPTISIPISADVQDYFIVIDNEDSEYYNEEGTWHYSVAQAYGPSSRYSYLNQGPGAYATFTTTLKKAGVYKIYEIVPTTENSANRALYTVSTSNTVLDSVYIDQNQGSGKWVLLGQYYLPASVPVTVKVMDTGESTGGDVLRADAIKFAITEEISDVKDQLVGRVPSDYHLRQNYPNPFNPETTVEFHLPKPETVLFTIYNLSGKRVKQIRRHFNEPGWHKMTWDGTNSPGIDAASGVYVYVMKAGNFTASKKMIKLQ